MKYSLKFKLSNRYNYENVLKQLNSEKHNESNKIIKMSQKLIIKSEKYMRYGSIGEIRFFKDFFIYNNSFNTIWTLILYGNLVDCKIISDDNKSISDTLSGAVIAGGLGAVANNIRKNTKYHVQIKLKNGHAETFKCSNIAQAEELNISFSSKIDSIFYDNRHIQDKSMVEFDLKSKLNEVKVLFDEGVISEEEYKTKRKQIIDKY